MSAPASFPETPLGTCSPRIRVRLGYENTTLNLDTLGSTAETTPSLSHQYSTSLENESEIVHVLDVSSLPNNLLRSVHLEILPDNAKYDCSSAPVSASPSFASIPKPPISKLHRSLVKISIPKTDLNPQTKAEIAQSSSVDPITSSETQALQNCILPTSRCTAATLPPSTTNRSTPWRRLPTDAERFPVMVPVPPKPTRELPTRYPRFVGSFEAPPSEEEVRREPAVPLPTSAPPVHSFALNRIAPSWVPGSGGEEGLWDEPGWHMDENEDDESFDGETSWDEDEEDLFSSECEESSYSGEGLDWRGVGSSGVSSPHSAQSLCSEAPPPSAFRKATDLDSNRLEVSQTEHSPHLDDWQGPGDAGTPSPPPTLPNSPEFDEEPLNPSTQHHYRAQSAPSERPAGPLRWDGIARDDQGLAINTPESLKDRVLNLPAACSIRGDERVWTGPSKFDFFVQEGEIRNRAAFTPVRFELPSGRVEVLIDVSTQECMRKTPKGVFLTPVRYVPDDFETSPASAPTLRPSPPMHESAMKMAQRGKEEAHMARQAEEAPVPRQWAKSQTPSLNPRLCYDESGMQEHH